ncbi:MAG: alpha-2-macroglobulin [bacterium]
MAIYSRNRWFILGILLIIVNAIAVLPAVWQWASPQFVSARMISPESGDLMGRDSLVVKFTSDMVSHLETGKWERIGPVTMTPPAAGLFKWTGCDELVFKPDNDWPKCTELKASLIRGLRSTDSRPVKNMKQFAFRTEPLSVVQAQQIGFEPGKTAVIQLRFNLPVTENDLAQHVTIDNRSSSTNLPFEITSFSGSTRDVIVTVPADSLLAATNELDVCLSAGLQSTAGPLGLTSDIRRPVLIYKNDLKVMNVGPEMRGPFGPRSIVASFSSQVDPQTITAYMTIEPAVTFTIEPAGDSYGHQDSAVRISGNFKPGCRYSLTFKAGLNAKSGPGLKNNVARSVYFDDAEPGLRITLEGKYLSPLGNMLLKFETMNLRKYKVTVRRVYGNNIVYLAMRGSRSSYYEFESSDTLGSKVFEKDTSFKASSSEIVRHELSARELTGGKAGVYFVEITGTDGNRTASDRQHLVVSDIGITAKLGLSDVVVWANSIRTLSSVDNATVRLYSEKNQELASGTTDSNGLARLSFSTNNLPGSPFVITAEKGEDTTYIVLNACRVANPDDQGGRNYLSSGYEAFLFTDRGVYRPGETVRLKTIIRSRNADCPRPFPVTLVAIRPDSKLLGKYSGMLNEYGTAEFAVPLPDYVPTGRYKFNIELTDSKELGTTSVSVEEFAPPQISTDVKTDATRCSPINDIRFIVSAQHLFGGPAAGLSAEGIVEFRPQEFTPSRWPGFLFGDSRRDFKTVLQPLGVNRLDADGKAEFCTRADAGWRPAASLRAVLIGTVTETSGRAITAVSSRNVDVYPFYIGIKNSRSLGTIGKESSFDIVLVRPDGSVVSNTSHLKAVIEKTVWSSIVRRQDNGTWSWCSEEQTSEVLSRDMIVNTGTGTFSFTPADWGQYRLAVTDPDSGVSSSVEFNACEEGQEWSDRSMESQGTVELKLDKERYLPGETARLMIRAPFAGKAMVTVESTNVIRHWLLNMTNNSAEVEIAVDAAFTPNVHCSISVIKPAKSEKIWGPHRAFGQCLLLVDSPERRLSVKLTVPEITRPRQKLEVDVETLDSAGHGAEAEVVIAAVDEGICMLTAFETPDPYAFFFAPRRCGVTQHDLYELLMPELVEQLTEGTSLPGGDGLASLGRRLNPVRTRRFKPVALWSSTFNTDASGKAKVSFEVPEFTGQLRLMAVAVDRQRFGNAKATVKVKRPLIVQTGLPRFLAPGDRCNMPVHIFNETGEAGEAVVTVLCRGSLECEGGTSTVWRVSVPKAASTHIEVPVLAREMPGAGVCRIEVALGSELFSDEIELPVRPPVTRITLTGSGRIDSGATAGLDISAAWMEGTGTNDIWISNLPSVELGGGLSYLLQYPYGCLEQTTSKSFPLLYLHDLAEQMYPGWLTSDQVTRFVDDGIARILSMQRYNGSFGVWLGSDAYPWGSVYATHFLVEASKAGYSVPPDRLQSACTYVVTIASGRHHGDDEEAADAYVRSYAVYVLALAGKPQHGAIGRLRQLPGFEHDRICRVNIAAALMASGLRKDGNELISGLRDAPTPLSHRETGGSLRSSARDDAILLSALIEADPTSALLPAVVERLNKARINGRWYTTQENALALMALGKYCRFLAKDRAPLAGSIVWNKGAQVTSFTNRDSFHSVLAGFTNGFVVITNSGNGPLYYSWETGGVPTDTRMKEESKGIVVRRNLLDTDGKPLVSSSLIQGKLYVVRLSFQDFIGGLENIVVEELLPAGLEIENPNLKTSRSISWLKERQTLPIIHTDIRDDRLILFPAPFSGSSEYFYAVRAVSTGTFALPPVSAECMYNSEIRSVQGAGILFVKKAEGR